MTVNCVITWEKSSSTPLIPFTSDRSKIPSFLSSNIAPEVNATAKKNMILEKVNQVSRRVFDFEGKDSREHNTRCCKVSEICTVVAVDWPFPFDRYRSNFTVNVARD
jgi:hypothetical protein